MRSNYQTSEDRDLFKKQKKHFPRYTQEIYVQRKEVPEKNGYRLVEPLIDPNHKPHELHLIKKIKSLNGEPWWVRTALQQLGFSVAKKKEWSVVYSVQPNTAEINNLLWSCKHMVKVMPVIFKNGYPAKSDLGNTKLNLETGELEIIKPIEWHETENKVKHFKVNDVNVTDQLRPSGTFKLDKEELRRTWMRKKELCQLNDEFFPTQYSYKYDNDKPGVTRLRGKPNTSVTEDGTSDDVLA